MPIYSYSFYEQNDTLPIQFISSIFNQDARVTSVLTLSLSWKIQLPGKFSLPYNMVASHFHSSSIGFVLKL